ncbi:hypothetical protein BH11VER1_BH11VER1_08150 [soil metagenome]
MAHSTLTSKGQTTIPREIRKVLGLSPGMMLAYEVRAGEVVVKRLRGGRSLMGSLRGGSKGKDDFKEARAAATKAWADEAAQEGL